MADEFPAAIVAVAGTVKTPDGEPVRLTTNASVVLPVRVIVKSTLLDVPTVDGPPVSSSIVLTFADTESDSASSSVTVSSIVLAFNPFAVAVIVTTSVLPTVVSLTALSCTVTDVCPAGIVTVLWASVSLDVLDDVS